MTLAGGVLHKYHVAGFEGALLAVACGALFRDD